MRISKLWIYVLAIMFVAVSAAPVVQAASMKDAKKALENPCAAKKLNPCAAKKLNPCAAKEMNKTKGENPCAAKGAAKVKAKNPCAGEKMPTKKALPSKAWWQFWK